jgi:hypothetical protein
MAWSCPGRRVQNSSTQNFTLHPCPSKRLLQNLISSCPWLPRCCSPEPRNVSFMCLAQLCKLGKELAQVVRRSILPPSSRVVSKIQWLQPHALCARVPQSHRTDLLCLSPCPTELEEHQAMFCCLQAGYKYAHLLTVLRSSSFLHFEELF